MADLGGIPTLPSLGPRLHCLPRAGRDALAIMDLVSRKWITTLTVPHQRSESGHIQAIYVRALESEGLLSEIAARMVALNSDELIPSHSPTS